MNYLTAIQAYLNSLSTSSKTYAYSRSQLAELLVVARENNYSIEQFLDEYLKDGVDKGRKATLLACATYALKNGYEFNIVGRDLTITKDSIHTQLILESWDELYGVALECNGFGKVAAFLAILGVNPSLMSTCTIHSDKVVVNGEVNKPITQRVITYTAAEAQLLEKLGITEEDVLLLNGQQVQENNTSFAGSTITDNYKTECPEGSPSLMAIRKASLRIRHREGMLIEDIATQYGITVESVTRNL
jgi:sulfur carrier protein ThiS